MAFTIPSQFKVVGPNADATGSAQISVGRGIGGNETADGQDESTILVQNARYLWTTANRCALAEATSYGQVSPQAAFYTNSSASYVEFAQVLVTLGANRNTITIHCDFIGQIQAEAFDNTDSSIAGPTATSSSATQIQDTISLDCGTDTDVYVKLSARQFSGTDPEVFSIVITEDAADVSTYTGSGYEYKKIDDDAANGLEPYDAYLLQGIARNLAATHKERGRAAGWLWPVDDRPKLAAHTTVAYPLGLWRVSPGCNEITVRLRLTVSDAAANFGLAVYDLFGSGALSSQATGTSVSAGGPKSQDLTLSFDAGLYEGRDVLLVLLARSEDSGTTYTKSYTASNIIKDIHNVDLGGAHGMTFTAGKRWKLEIDDPSGTNIPDGVPFPGPRTVNFEADPDLYVWPYYERSQLATPDWATGTYTATVTEIGNAELLSVHVRETGFEALSDMKRRLHPGHAPSARAIKTLYVREREHWIRRSRCHRAIVTPWDPALKTNSDVVSYWGTVEEYQATWTDMAACMVRGYDASLHKDGSTVQYRATLRISGLVVLATRERRNFDLQVRAKLASYSGGWSSNEVTSDTVTLPITSVPYWSAASPYHNTADLVGTLHSNKRRAYGFLRGAIDVTEMASRSEGLMPFELTITDTQTAADPRLCRVQLKGAATDANSNPVAADQTAMWLAAVSIWTVEEVGG